MNSKVIEILKKHNLRKTSCRFDTLHIFLNHQKKALSQNDIEKLTKGRFDRVTIYRTLNTFIEQGILHRIFDENNSVKFALCPDECSSHNHQHDHIHFKCNKCKTTTCIDEVTLVDIQLPKGYIKQEANYLIIGICKNCLNKST